MTLMIFRDSGRQRRVEKQKNMFTCLLEILLHKLPLIKKGVHRKKKKQERGIFFPVNIIKKYFKVIIDREYSRFRPTTLEGWRAKTFQEERTAATARMCSQSC